MSFAPLTPLAELAAGLSSGRWTALALVEAALARAADPSGEGARVFVRLDAEAALDAAAAWDRRRAAGEALPPLAGIPVSIKDLADIAGQVTTAGSVVLADRPPAGADAPAVARLRQAGAVIVGRTTMTEFAYSGIGLNPHYGTPGNPADRARIPGGSSSGAAVSVADGMAAAALGTDTGGSVRIPAALCGLVGFKPTVGRVPTEGVVPLSTTFDSIGPLVPSVACAALMDAVMAGLPPPRLGPPPLAGLRLGVPEGLVWDGLDADTASATAAALDRLSAAGVVLERFAWPADLDADTLWQVNGPIIAAEAHAWHEALFAARRAGYDPMVAARLERGRDITAVDYIRAQERLRSLRRATATVTAGFAAVVMPTVAVVAPRLDQVAAAPGFEHWNRLVLRNTTVGNLLGRCVITLPCPTHGRPPVGLSLMGEAGSDARLLDLAAALEAIICGAGRPGASAP